VSDGLVEVALQIAPIRDITAKALVPWFRHVVASDPEASLLLRDAESLTPVERAHLRGPEFEKAVSAVLSVAALLASASPSALPTEARAASLTVLSNATRAPRNSKLSRAVMRRLDDVPAEDAVLAQAVAAALQSTEPSDDRSQDFRWAELLARFDRVPAGVEPTLERLLAPPPPDPDVSILDRLRYANGWPRVRPALAIKALGAGYSAPRRARLAAIDALGKVEGDPTKARSALASLGKDADPQVRYRAARALRRLSAAK
jgi:hypothetical protein